MAAAPGPDVDAIAASARTGEPDRYLAALLAPPDARDALMALAAFSAELAHVSHMVTREPMMGEIRLQWWRDALGPVAARTGHPVADAVRATAQRHALPQSLLLDLIEARVADLRPDPFADDEALSAHLAHSEGALFALAAHVLRVPPGAERDAACAACGQAYGLVRLLLALPHALSRGRLLLPRAHLEANAAAGTLLFGAGEDRAVALLADLRAQARRHIVTCRQHVMKLPRSARVAFLPLALVEPYLRALERPGRDPLREGAELAPLTRIWRIAAAHWLGRL